MKPSSLELLKKGDSFEFSLYGFSLKLTNVVDLVIFLSMPCWDSDTDTGYLEIIVHETMNHCLRFAVIALLKHRSKETWWVQAYFIF